jgi:methionine synthase II (cobalamin-independent)
VSTIGSGDMRGKVSVDHDTASPRRLRLPVGLATSIGSLPHVDPGEAVDFVLRHQQRLPAAPSLPGRSRREGMVAQAAHGVAGITVGTDGSLVIDDATLDPEAPLTDPGFSNDAFIGLRAFLTAVGERRGPVKLSVTGPVTLGVALHAAGVDADLAFRIAGAAVGERARALVDYAGARVPEAQLVCFVDEPVLGSAMLEEFPLSPLDAVDLASSALAAVEHGGAISGLHCCATDADWRLLMQAGPNILSLPTDGGLERAAGAFASFLEEGGWVAWGAVPTDRPIGTTVDRMWRQLSMLWSTLVTEGGCDPVLLRTQAMITPACGLARHGVPQAEQVLWFTNRLAERLHDQAIGVRYPVGA